MAKEKLTEVESIVDKAPPTFEVVGFKISEQMHISIDGRQVNLAHPTPELAAWLYERREKLSGLRWTH